MKKFVTALFLLLICFNPVGAFAEDAEKFVNPLFYRTMEPYSKLSWKTQVTPTQIIKTNSEGYSVKYDCNLLKNDSTEIEMLCEHYNHLVNSVVKYVFSFTLLGPYGDTDFWKDNVMVEEKSKQKEKEQWSSYNNLIIARGASDQ